MKGRSSRQYINRSLLCQSRMKVLDLHVQYFEITAFDTACTSVKTSYEIVGGPRSKGVFQKAY